VSWCERNARETFSGLLVLFALTALVTHCSGCGFLAKHGPALVDILSDVTKCALSNMNLPDDVILKRCAVPEDLIPKVLPLLGTARQEAAREAAYARADEYARVSVGLCDGGSP